MQSKSYNITLSTGATYHITLTDEYQSINTFEKWLIHGGGVLDSEKLDIEEWQSGLWLNRKYIVSVVTCKGFDEENRRVTDQ